MDAAKSPFSLFPKAILSAKVLTLLPQQASDDHQQVQWYGVDGEPFEAVTLNCSILPSRIRVYMTNNLT